MKFADRPAQLLPVVTTAVVEEWLVRRPPEWTCELVDRLRAEQPALYDAAFGARNFASVEREVVVALGMAVVMTWHMLRRQAELVRAGAAS